MLFFKTKQINGPKENRTPVYAKSRHRLNHWTMGPQELYPNINYKNLTFIKKVKELFLF